MSTLFQVGLDKTDALVAGFVSQGFSALSSHYAGAVHSAFILYVIMLALNYLYGEHFTLAGFARSMVKGSAVYLFALNFSYFNTFVYAVVNNGPREIADVILSSMGPAGSAGLDQRALLDNAYDRMTDAAARSFAQGTIWNRGPWVGAGFIYLGAIVFLGMAFMLMVAAKLGLALLLVLSPVIIPCALFSVSKSVFWSWVHSIVGFALLPVIVSVLCAFGLFLFMALGAMEQIAGGDASIGDAGVVLILCIVVGFLLWQSQGLAASLAGSSAHGHAGQALIVMAAAPITAGASLAGGLAMGAGGAALNGVKAWRRQMAAQRAIEKAKRSAQEKEAA